MRKKIKWSLRTGAPIQKAGEQLIALPLAISDHDGNPIKGQKSNMTKALANRYKNCPEPIVLHDYPPQRQPQCCLLEGMFMINTSPIGTQTTYGDYANFLMQRHIKSLFLKGCTEVHLLFDNPGQLKNTPKQFEQKRRDQSAPVVTDHACANITESTELPKKWRENVINCRKCKRTLVCFLSQFMLKHIHTHLLPHQKFYVAGAFAEPLTTTCWFVEGSKSPQPDPKYSCNAEETDTFMATCNEDQLQHNSSAVSRYRRLYYWLASSMHPGKGCHCSDKPHKLPRIKTTLFEPTTNWPI